MSERETVTIDRIHYEELIRQNNIYNEILSKLYGIEYQLVTLKDKVETRTKGETE